MSAPRILAVEDSPAQAALVVADLEDEGFDVTLAVDGEQALERLAEAPYDLVLSDVVMPGIDGYGLCRAVKAAHPELPVILLTSLTDPMEIVHALEAGADNFLRKPYDRAQLSARVRAALAPRGAAPGGGGVADAAEVVLADRRVRVSAERQQILGLLLSSFEDLVVSNKELHERELALRAAQEQLRVQLDATEQERRRIATVLGAAPQAMVILAPDGTITDVSDDLCRLVGVAPHALVGRPVDEVLAFADATGRRLGRDESPLAVARREARPVERGASFDLYLERADGAQLPVIVRTAPVHDGRESVLGVVAAVQEIGALASHDPVTKLPHQGVFADRVARAVSAAPAGGGGAAVLVVVIDRFDLLRENVTAEEASAFLAGLADRLRAGLHGAVDGSAAYFGHDTFAAVLRVADEVDARRWAQHLASRLAREPLDVGGLELAVSVSVGVVVDVGSSTDDPVRLVSAAATAARRASAAGGDRVVMADPAADARAGDWLQRRAALRTAIEEGQLRLHYQPVVDVRTGRPSAVEALVRWQHPDHGLLGPDAFLPLAREAGLIAPLGWWVLDEACREAASWRAGATPELAHLSVSVNLDAQQLADPAMARRVAATLTRTGLDPSALVLEITENGVTDDPDQAAERLRSLKALGVRVAIDDFGTGYSSLVQLRRFPVDSLKIDKSFVDGMTSEAEDAAIVASTVRLARALGIDVVAEGVETEEQLVQLRVLGCDLGQGYHWARPVPPDELHRWSTAAARAASEATAADSAPAEADDAQAALDELVAYLVHELRSPLTVISGYARMAVDDDPSIGDVLDPILRGAADMEQRIATLADTRAVSQGTMVLDLQTIDLVDLVRTLVHDLGPQLRPHPLTVEGDEPVLARVDTTRVGQAVTNLLTNAAKFSPPTAPIEVTVRAGASRAAIVVRDHGPGVPEERRPELFRRFARLGSRVRGMGVGLYLVRAIARAHGGDAHYEPAAGGGSCFGLSLPLDG